jgi:lipoate synthase
MCVLNCDGQKDKPLHLSITLNSSPTGTVGSQMETVERLQRRVRDYRAGYKQTLGVLEHAKVAAAAYYSDPAHGRSGRDLVTKTSLMLGLGERDEEIRAAMRDLRSAGVDVVTFGQYLRPTQRHISVQRYVTPEEFDQWRVEAQDMGFKYVFGGYCCYCYCLCICYCYCHDTSMFLNRSSWPLEFCILFIMSYFLLISPNFSFFLPTFPPIGII